jgi:hypothetical protein
VTTPTGERVPVMFFQSLGIGGGAFQHHGRPAGPWPQADEAVLDELQGQGMIAMSGWGNDPRSITPTERGRRLIEEHDRAMTDVPVADVSGLLAAVDGQATATNKLAWPAVRPVLAALRAYWEAGGFSQHGIAIAALRHALPDEYDGMFRATILALSYTQMLWMRVKRKAAYLPGC